MLQQRNPDYSANEELMPFQLPQVPYMSPDLVIPGVLDEALKDDNLWIPTSDSVSFKPLLLNTSSGYYINLLRVRKSGVYLDIVIPEQYMHSYLKVVGIILSMIGLQKKNHLLTNHQAKPILFSYLKMLLK